MWLDRVLNLGPLALESDVLLNTFCGGSNSSTWGSEFAPEAHNGNFCTLTYILLTNLVVFKA